MIEPTGPLRRSHRLSRRHYAPAHGPDNRGLPTVRGIARDTFEERAHERQVLVTIKNLPEAVPLAVSRDEFDADWPSTILPDTVWNLLLHAGPEEPTA
jgi:hypothetical protein